VSGDRTVRHVHDRPTRRNYRLIGKWAVMLLGLAALALAVGLVVVEVMRY
jgi:hypothetical protein